MIAFCAICGDDIVGEPRREPRGEALVDVCGECSTEFNVVVTAPTGWSQSHGIDMLTTRTFKDKPIGFTVDGWTVAARHLTRAEAACVKEDVWNRGLDAFELIFYEEVS